MADEQTEATPEEGGKKKLPIMTIAVIAVVMVVEAAVLGGLFMMVGGGPETAQAEENAEDPLAEEEELVEVLLIADKFQNSRQGSQAYLYDTTIYVLVKRKNHGTPEEIEAGEGFDAMIEANLARIRSEIVGLFARAEPAHLNEPEHQTLRRQILERCHERFGDAPDGEPYVQDVVISDWKRFSTDI